MPRLQPIYPDLFYDPLTEDVEELLACFQHTDSVRFEVFSAVWREMGFSDVFIGLNSIGELKRFTRITLATAVKYFLPPHSYQIRVAGLYLMFAFYHTQPSVPPVPIRLAVRDYDDVQKFLQDSVDSGHHDIVYIYGKLEAAKAIHYAAMPHFLTFKKQHKSKQEAVCIEFLDRVKAVQELLPAEILEELSNIQSQYEKMKEATAEVKSKVTNMTHRDLTRHLKDSVSEFVTWQHNTFSNENKDKEEGDSVDDDDKETPADSSSRRARLLSSIKQKSYSNFQEASKARRHRQSETVVSSSSGTEHHHDQEASAQQKKKQFLSLRARTWKSFGVTQDESKLQAWLLSAPDQEERVPMKRVYQNAPYKP